MKNLYVKSAASGAFALVLVASSASAQTPPPTTSRGPDIRVVANPTYVTNLMEITVDRPAAEVWARVGKFCFVAQLDPFPFPCTILMGKDGEIGAVRSYGKAVLVGKSDLSYTSVQLISNTFNLYATLEVKPLTAMTSKIVYTQLYDESMLPDDAAREGMKSGLIAAWTGMMQDMKVLAEGGTLPPPAALATAPPRIAFSAIVHGAHSLSGDGLGSYVDAVNSSSVFNREAFTIFVWDQVSPLNNKPDPTATAPRQRFMTFDLSRPVEGSGAVKLPTGKDDLARFHVFWKHDHGATERFSFMREIPIGTTVDSDRVEMWVRVNSVQHVLQVGPWAMGEFSDRAPIDGKGTTKATITRETEDSWRIKAPNGSIARLWDYSDIEHPVDKGLYYFDFDVEFTKLK